MQVLQVVFGMGTNTKNFGNMIEKYASRAEGFCVKCNNVCLQNEVYALSARKQYKRKIWKGEIIKNVKKKERVRSYLTHI